MVGALSQRQSAALNQGQAGYSVQENVAQVFQPAQELFGKPIVETKAFCRVRRRLENLRYLSFS